MNIGNTHQATGNSRKARIVGVVACPLHFAILSKRSSPGKLYRLGFLSEGFSGPSPDLEAFRQGLRDLGYIEGKNLLIEYRYAEGKGDRYPELVSDLVRLKVDVIVANGT